MNNLRPELRDYLLGSISSSLLLIGQNKTNMMEDALTVASSLLEVERTQMDTHPDYAFIGTEGSSMGVDVAEQILGYGVLMPAISKKKVILVDGINKMTVQAQNKLLKLIEESKYVILIGLAYEDSLIHTVKSRMSIVYYRPVSLDEYLAASDQDGADGTVLYFATGGGLETMDQNKIQYFSDVKNAIDRNVPLFEALHLVKEKDDKSFFSVYRESVGAMISFIGSLLVRKAISSPELLDQITRCNLNRSKCMAVSYTKDDFFRFIAELRRR